MKRITTLLLAATVAAFPVTGCNRVPSPFVSWLRPGRPPRNVEPPRYVVFADLTGSGNGSQTVQPASKNANSRKGQPTSQNASSAQESRPTSRIPVMILQTVQALVDAQSDREPFTIEVRGITCRTNAGEYATSYTFNAPNQGPVQAQHFITGLAPTIAAWLKDYQAKKIQGSDIFGGLHKLATIGDGLLPHESLCCVFVSDFIHEQVPDPGQAHFSRPTRVYCLLSNDTADPKVSEGARKTFADQVREAGGTYQLAADAQELRRMLDPALLARNNG